jgi:hypothetical protein
MNQIDIKLESINSFLGGSISSLLKSPKCQLLFESEAKVNMDGKTRKSCIIYIIGEYILICRPRKYTKKYYVKFMLPIHKVSINKSNPYIIQEDGKQPCQTQKNDNLITLTLNTDDGTYISYYLW